MILERGLFVQHCCNNIWSNRTNKFNTTIVNGIFDCRSLGSLADMTFNITKTDVKIPETIPPTKNTRKQFSFARQ